MHLPIRIRHLGRELLLDYERFLDYHGGGALAGATIGWRAMERAALALSASALWDRDTLWVSARHAGPGIRDALEYVTCCFSRERFRSLPTAASGSACGSAADFQFSVSDGRQRVLLQLVPDIVPDSFFTAVQRCREMPDSDPARVGLHEQKALVADIVARRALSALFHCEVTVAAASAEIAHA